MSALDRPSIPRRLLRGLGWLQTQLLLHVAYFAVLGPVALVTKVLRHDPLAVRRVEPRWHPLPPEPEGDDERQY